MIAACPRCAARYRIEKEKLRPDGVRLRCAKCEAVFRVRPPTEEEELAPEAVAAPPSAARRARRGAGRHRGALGPGAARERAAGARPGELVLVGMPDADAGKALEEALRALGSRGAWW